MGPPPPSVTHKFDPADRMRALITFTFDLQCALKAQVILAGRKVSCACAKYEMRVEFYFGDA